MLHFILILILVLFDHCSRGAEKYFRQGSRLNWPEGAESRESSRAVQKLEHLEVWIIQASCKCTFGIISHLQCQIVYLCSPMNLIIQDLISRHVNSSKSCLFIDLLYKLLRFDPSQRLTAKEALNHPFFKIKASTLQDMFVLWSFTASISKVSA